MDLILINYYMFLNNRTYVDARILVFCCRYLLGLMDHLVYESLPRCESLSDLTRQAVYV